MQVLLVSTYDYIGTHAYDYLVLGCFYFYLSAMPLYYVYFEFSYPCNARSSIPIPTVFSILLFTAIVTTAIFTSLLLLFHYCHFNKTVTTDKSLRARLLSGAAEQTTHMLRLISILWLPLCQINKLGFTSLEDRGNPLYLWVIKTIFWRRCRGA